MWRKLKWSVYLVRATAKLLINKEAVEQVKQFKYLESLISENEYCETDMKTRKNALIFPPA